jgi:hypothetical protein
MGDKSGRIFQRNFNKGKVNRDFKLFKISAERDKEGVKS